MDAKQTPPAGRKVIKPPAGGAHAG